MKKWIRKRRGSSRIRKPSRFDIKFDDLTEVSRANAERASDLIHTVVEELGEGGTGAVYLANLDDGSGEKVAIKTVRECTSMGAPLSALDIEYAERALQREAAIIAALDHPNVLAPGCEAFCISNKQLRHPTALVLEYCVGGSLSRLLRSDEILSEGRRCALSVGVAAGLAHMHALGFAHLDVKSQNVLLTEDYEPKLADFDTSVEYPDSPRHEMGDIGFTAAYAAPERLLREVVDLRQADVFSYGILVCEIWTRAPPFQQVRLTLEGDTLLAYLTRCYSSPRGRDETRPPFEGSVFAPPSEHDPIIPADVKGAVEQWWLSEWALRPSADGAERFWKDRDSDATQHLGIGPPRRRTVVATESSNGRSGHAARAEESDGVKEEGAVPSASPPAEEDADKAEQWRVPTNLLPWVALTLTTVSLCALLALRRWTTHGVEASWMDLSALNSRWLSGVITAPQPEVYFSLDNVALWVLCGIALYSVVLASATTYLPVPLASALLKICPLGVCEPCARGAYPFGAHADNKCIVREEGHVRQCSLLGLVQQVTDPSATDDPALCDVLVLTHKSYSSTVDVLNLLIKRFLTPSTMAVGTAMDIHLQVVAVINKWIMKALEDFREPTALRRLRWFLLIVMPRKDLRCSGVVIDRHVTRQLAAQSALALQVNNPILSACPSPLDVDAAVLAGAHWAALPPLEVARQLCLVEWEMFAAIRAHELNNLAWSRADKDTAAPHIIAMIARFNQTNKWVKGAILKGSDTRARARAIKFFVEVADHLMHLRNYNGVYEIISALAFSKIASLRKTLELVPSKCVDLWNSMKKFCSPWSNYKHMRQADLTPPCLPYLGLYLKDLAMMAEAPTMVDSMINVKKFRGMADVICGIQRVQLSPFLLATSPRLHAALAAITLQKFPDDRDLPSIVE